MVIDQSAGEPTEGIEILFPTLPHASASASLPVPADPATRYLELLAAGHLPAYARSHCGYLTDDAHTDDDTEWIHLLRVARENQEYRDLEALLTGRLAGDRPALAKAFLAHTSLGAAVRLERESREAPHARDRIRAQVALLDHGPLAPSQAPAAGTIQISAGQLSMLVLALTPDQLAALAPAPPAVPPTQ